MHPLTKILVHKNEKPGKCTILPLQGSPELEFFRFPGETFPQLTNYIRLVAEARELSYEDRDLGILLIDGTWRKADIMNRQISHLEERGLSGWQTAYPRVSKLYIEPLGGLATIEALYACNTILGRNNEGILQHYFWRDEFLRLNRQKIELHAKPL